MARRVYDLEFKKDVVRLTYESGKSCMEISKDVGVPINTIYRWRDELISSGAVKIDKDVVEQAEEIKRLKAELADTKMERDILKKAMAIFLSNKK